MPERSDADVHAVRTIAVVCLAMVLAILAPSVLVAMGWPALGLLMFFGFLVLWPVLALLSAWALTLRHRAQQGC